MRILVAAVCFATALRPMWAEASEGEMTPAAMPESAVVRPLERAHAHNDYYHARPLLDALDRGFCSVEADVFLVNGMLLVGHEPSELCADRTLESLYLDPLLERIRRNDGQVYPGGPDFTLLVDVKSEGKATYLALDRVLAEYEEMVASVEDGTVHKRAVTVIISGNRAWDVIAADATRYAGVDGRLPDLESDRPAHLMPLVSDRWGGLFEWVGEGPMPEMERTKLRQFVRDAHASGRRLRFWATPDRPSQERAAVWNELLEAGVDLIGTDDLEGLKSYLLLENDGCP
jgi:hypothetical protein